MSNEPDRSAVMPEADGTTSRVRPALREEASEISALVGAALAQFEGHVPTAWLRDYVAVSRNVEARWDKGQVMVAEREDRIVATVTYYADAARDNLGLPSRWAGFRTLAVDPSARGKGFGRQLVDWCVRTARLEGARTMGIHAAPFLKVACGLYERTGFQRCPEYDVSGADVGFDISDGYPQVIAYRLQLSPDSTTRGEGWERHRTFDAAAKKSHSMPQLRSLAERFS